MQVQTIEILEALEYKDHRPIYYSRQKQGSKHAKFFAAKGKDDVVEAIVKAIYDKFHGTKDQLKELVKCEDGDIITSENDYSYGYVFQFITEDIGNAIYEEFLDTFECINSDCDKEYCENFCHPCSDNSNDSEESSDNDTESVRETLCKRRKVE